MSYDDEAPWFAWTDEDLARLVDGASVLAHWDTKSTERIKVNIKAGGPTFDRLFGMNATRGACTINTRQCDPATIVPPAPKLAKAGESVAHIDGGTKAERLAHAREAALKARRAVGLADSYLSSSASSAAPERPVEAPRPRPKRLADVLTGAVQLCMAELVQAGGWKRADVERAADRIFRDAEGQLMLLPEQLVIDLLRVAASGAKHLGEPIERTAARAAGLLRR